MIPAPDDDRPLGRTFREVDRKTGANEPWFMRAKRQYAEEEAARRTIVEEKTLDHQQETPRPGGYAHPMQNSFGQMDDDPRNVERDLVKAKMHEMEQELTAIREIFAQLAPLEGGKRKRVFAYVSEMLGELP